MALSAIARLGDSFSQDSMKIEVVDVIGAYPWMSSDKLMRILNEVNENIGWGGSSRDLISLSRYAAIPVNGSS